MSQIIGFLGAVERANAQASIANAAMARLAYHADKNEWKKGVDGAMRQGRPQRKR